MKKISFFVALSLFALQPSAQVWVIDPILAGVVAGDGVTTNLQLENIKDRQSAIEKLQAGTLATVGFINDWQKKIYTGLSQVSGTLQNAQQLVQCYKYVDNIIKSQSDMLEDAKDNPLLLAFAYKHETEMITRAIGVYGRIKTIILKEDEKLLMDAGERTMLLNAVQDELMMLAALSYGAARKVHWAKINGIVQSLNPFAGYVNRDAAIVKDILSKF